MTQSPRVLLLSMKAGAGHIRAAEAIREAIELQNENCTVRHIDALEYMSAFFRVSFIKLYFSMLGIAPSLWRMIYEQTEKQAIDSLSKRATNFFNRLHAGRLMREVSEFDPDCVICTHFIPAGLLAPLRCNGKLRAKLSVVITDFDLHAAWLHRGVDQYFVASEEVARKLRAVSGTAGIEATGIPIMPAFSKPFPDKAEMRRRLNLDPNRKTVLLTGGGCGLGPLDQIVVTLSREFPDAQFLTVAGNNKKLLASLQELTTGTNKTIIPLGFVNNLHDYMAASDFAVTKPGGLTVSECLAMFLPMILIDPIPGQEERNAAFLLEYRVAVMARNTIELTEESSLFVNNTQVLSEFSNRARALSKAAAAQRIAASC